MRKIIRRTVKLSVVFHHHGQRTVVKKGQTYHCGICGRTFRG